MKFNILNRFEVEIKRSRDTRSNSNYRAFRVPEICNSNKIYSEDNTNCFFVHIHLPKTGGTTFNTILKRNFQDSYEPFEGRFIHLYPKLTSAQIISFIEKHPGIDAVSSHSFQAVLPYQNASKKIVAVAFVRNPVDKFFSFYFHMRHRHGVKCIEKELNLKEYVAHKRKQTQNKLPGYLQMLTGFEGEGALNYISDLVSNKHLYLFDTYQMKNAVEFLKSTFPSYFSSSYYEKENISKKDQEITESMREEVREITSEFDWKIMNLVHK